MTWHMELDGEDTTNRMKSVNWTPRWPFLETEVIVHPLPTQELQNTLSVLQQLEPELERHPQH